MNWEGILKNVESQQQRFDKCCQKAKKQFKQYMDNKIYEEDSPPMRAMMRRSLEEALQTDCHKFWEFLNEYVSDTINRHDDYMDGFITNKDPAISDEQFEDALNVEINLLQKIVDEWEECDEEAME